MTGLRHWRGLRRLYLLRRCRRAGAAVRPRSGGRDSGDLLRHDERRLRGEVRHHHRRDQQLIESATLEVRVAPPTLNGAAPGVALPGTSGIVVYGTGLGVATSVLLSGPVYLLGRDDPSLQHRRSRRARSAPRSSRRRPRARTGSPSRFSLPSNAATGTYLLEARVGQFLSAERRAVPRRGGDTRLRGRGAGRPQDRPAHPSRADRRGNPCGRRAELPLRCDGLQPVLFLRHGRLAHQRPHGAGRHLRPVVRSGEPRSRRSRSSPPTDSSTGTSRASTTDPGVDFNATITNARLPNTGLYIILAETARGSGAYRLSFSFSSLAPASPEDRVIPVAGNHVTGHVGDAITSWAQVLDPRGYPLTGAAMTFRQAAEPGDTGTIQFTSGANVSSTSLGMASVRATLTSFGRVGFAPVLQETFAAPAAVAPEAAAFSARTTADDRIPLYPAVAMRPFTVGYFDGELLGVESTRFERFPLAPRSTHVGPVAEAPSSKGVLASGPGARASAPARPYGPDDEARGEVPAARFEPPGLLATSCQDGLRFHTFAVLPSAQINAPLRVTLEDLTPSTGQSTPNGPVGDKGIYGHRIEKEIRLRIKRPRRQRERAGLPGPRFRFALRRGGRPDHPRPRWDAYRMPHGDLRLARARCERRDRRAERSRRLPPRHVLGLRRARQRSETRLALDRDLRGKNVHAGPGAAVGPAVRRPPGTRDSPTGSSARTTSASSAASPSATGRATSLTRTERSRTASPRSRNGVRNDLNAYHLVDEYENVIFGAFDTSVIEGHPLRRPWSSLRTSGEAVARSPSPTR